MTTVHQKKRVLALIICAALSLGLLSAAATPALAAASAETFKTKLNGEGTADSPFLVTSAENLRFIADLHAAAHNTNSSPYDYFAAGFFLSRRMILI
jgi:glutamate synthase domain-containing protein 2